MSAVRIALALFGSLYLVLGPLRSPGDGDLYWQRWLGNVVLQTRHIPTALGRETFTSTGASWIPQEWLFSALVAAAMNHGLFLLFALFVSSIPAAILLSVYARTRNRASPEVAAIVLILCGIALAESFGIRAQVLGWGCFAAFLLFLDRRDRWFYAAIPVVAIWANLHASVMIAPAIILARIAGAFAGSGLQALRGNRDLRVFPLILFATCCSPLGWHLPVYALTLVESPIRHFIMEWQPAGFGDSSFAFGALPVALIILATGVRNIVRHTAEIFPVAMLFVAMLTASRNIPLFAIAAAPLAARSLDIIFPRLYTFNRRLQRMEPAALTSLCVAVVLSGLFLAWNQRHEPPRLPNAAISSLATNRGGHRVFCENFTWCSMALQYPNLRVFMDGRCDPYPVEIWKSYMSAVTVRRSWNVSLQRYGVDAVLASRGSRLSEALAADASWRASFQDSRFVVYLRRG
ncbi:MAG: hypothetical protein ACXWNK_10400 [Vulcanimicrobiaceae bacterium]